MNNEAERRHERMLWGEPAGGVSYPAPVLGIDHAGPLDEDALDDYRARRDDAFWARFVMLPVTPQRFFLWWIARRWIMPRDIRRR